MTDNRRPQSQECDPPTDHPAPQPHPPGGSCDPLPPAPDPPKPKDPTPCPPPPYDCNCPPAPPSSQDCLEALSTSLATKIAASKKNETYKADIDKLLATAKTAAQDYTQAKYEDLVKEWVRQDAKIAALIHKVVCNVRCWRCIIECFICPLLNDLHDAEQRLYGDGSLYSDVHNLYDLLYWTQRDKEAKERIVARIKAVLAAWEKPAATIEAILKQNASLYDAIDKAPSSDAGKVIFDLFLKLVPMHLAIAPPKSPDLQTKIDEKYTIFCECDKPNPDDCCGPDVGELSLRQLILGSQPYLVEPKYYFAIICCLVEKRLQPAQDNLTKAETEWAKADAAIKNLKAKLENGLKKDNFEKAAKGAIPGEIDCCKYERHDDDRSSYRSRS